MSVDRVGDRPDKPPGKNTEYKATINFRLENVVCKDRSTRKDREKYPLWITLNSVHNHSLATVGILQIFQRSCHDLLESKLQP